MSFGKGFRCRSACVLVAAVFLAVASPGAAQDLGGALDLGQLGADIGVNRAIQSHLAQSARARSGPRPAAPEQASRARLTYTPSMAQRRRNLAQFVAASRKRDPQGAARLEETFVSQDLIGAIERRMAPYGFRANDLGDAYAAWWLNAWLASRGRTDDPTPQQIAAVRAQAAAALGTLPEIRTASDAVKQEAAEAYLLQTALIGSYLEQADGHPDQIKRLAVAVLKGARAAGMDLPSLELTASGFVAR